MTVLEGADQGFNIEPESGCQIADMQVEGDSVSAVTTYTFEDVAANHTIDARFAINTDTIIIKKMIEPVGAPEWFTFTIDVR